MHCQHKLHASRTPQYLTLQPDTACITTHHVCSTTIHKKPPAGVPYAITPVLPPQQPPLLSSATLYSKLPLWLLLLVMLNCCCCIRSYRTHMRKRATGTNCKRHARSRVMQIVCQLAQMRAQACPHGRTCLHRHTCMRLARPHVDVYTGMTAQITASAGWWTCSSSVRWGPLGGAVTR